MQLSRIEKGSGTSASTLERIAAILGVDIPILIDEPEATLHRSIRQTRNFVIATFKDEGYTRLGVDFESFNPTAYNFWLK